MGLIPKNAFPFNPEVPLASLKTLPIGNEIEQMLDNPRTNNRWMTWSVQADG